MADEPLLAYETPRSPPPRISIERFEDGGVTVTIRSRGAEEVWRAIRPWVAAALMCVAAAWLVSHHFGYMSSAMLLVLVALAACLGMAALRLWRWKEPIVIGISPRGAYIDDPKRIFRRCRHFRLNEVIILQPVTYPVLTRDGKVRHHRHFVEVQFKHGLPLNMLDGTDRDEVIAVSGALRQALGWDPAPAPAEPQSLKSSSNG